MRDKNDINRAENITRFVRTAHICAVLVNGMAVHPGDWANEMYIRTQRGLGVVV